VDLSEKKPAPTKRKVGPGKRYEIRLSRGSRSVPAWKTFAQGTCQRNKAKGPTEIKLLREKTSMLGINREGGGEGQAGGSRKGLRTEYRKRQQENEKQGKMN